MSRDLLSMAFALASWGVGEAMFIFFSPLYLQQLGANPLKIGAILGAIGTAMMVAHIPAGYLSDRFGRRPLLVSAWIMGTLATLIMVLADSMNFFALGLILYGATAYVSSPMSSYITAARGNWSVGRALTLLSAIYNLGGFSGSLIGGWLGNTFGLRANFLAASLFFMLSTLFIFRIRPQPIETAGPATRQDRLRSLFSPSFRRYLILIFFCMFSAYLAQPLSQNFLQDQRGVDLLEMGALISARSLGIVALNLLLGQFSARAGFLLAQLSMACFALLIWQGRGFAWYAAAYFLLGSYQTARSLVNAQGRQLTNAATMGLAYGVLESVMAAATILAPLLAGWIYQHQPENVYSLSLVLIIIALIIAFFQLPRPAAQEA